MIVTLRRKGLKPSKLPIFLAKFKELIVNLLRNRLRIVYYIEIIQFVDFEYFNEVGYK